MNRNRPKAIAIAKRATPAPGRAAWLALLLAAAVACALAARAFSDDAPDPEPFPVTASQPAKLLSRVEVVYPDAARRAGIGGVVVVNARVGRDGRVRETRIANSIPELDDFAAAAVRRYEFSPAMDGDREVEVWVLAPVRFDESLPSGTRFSGRSEARLYTDIERSFESDVAVLRQSEPHLPDAESTDLHLRIMADSHALETIPAPGDDAIHSFLRGDTLARSPQATVREGRKSAWLEAAYLAPWWPLPYRRLASVAIAERDFPTAEACARILLAARPADAEAAAMLKRIGQLRRANHSDRHAMKQ